MHRCMRAREYVSAGVRVHGCVRAWSGVADDGVVSAGWRCDGCSACHNDGHITH